MSRLFAVTLFVSAALLFVVQPMVGKLVLPLLGGTPAVWATCMVFFQAVLLAGYAYAHAAPAWLGIRRHAVLHILLLVLPWLVLPLGLPDAWSDPGHSPPVPWLLGLLTITVGLPFFVLSTSAPLLQRWLSATRDPSAGDPYFLYVASNLGSLLALLGYPLLIEPLLTLSVQRIAWTVGYSVFMVMAVVCVVWLWRATPAEKDTPTAPDEVDAPDWRRRGRWVVLSLVPSGLLLSVTTYITTDLAAVPLLWVLPLSLYLLTFILAFARKPIIPPAVLGRWMPLLVLVLTIVLLSGGTELAGAPVGAIVGLHLIGFFWIALFCHTELARDRPSPRHLTGFYLTLSAGGVLGGLFTALLAPLLFSSVVEYPLLLVLACLLRPAPERPDRWDVALPVGLGVLTAGLVLLSQYLDVDEGPLRLAVMFAGPAFVCYLFLARPLRFGLGIAGLMLAGSLYEGVYGQTEERVRSFFGVHRVTVDPTGNFRVLVHGNTVHGMQSLKGGKARGEPRTYYHRTGPAGQALTALHGDDRLNRVGLVGLGTGALFAYAEEGQAWTCYEIDPAVIYLARDSGWFTFLDCCPASTDIVEGDGRLTLNRSEERYGVLVLDAFSSDAIPTHLLTREALAVYRRHLRDDGLLLFNISNRYLDLAPVLAALARDADMVAFTQEDLALSEFDKRDGKYASQWVLLAPSPEAAAKVLSPNWRQLRAHTGDRPWTDDYSNPLRALKRD